VEKKLNFNGISGSNDILERFEQVKKKVKR